MWDVGCEMWDARPPAGRNALLPAEVHGTQAGRRAGPNDRFQALSRSVGRVRYEMRDVRHNDFRYSEPKAHAPPAQISEIIYSILSTRYSILATRYSVLTTRYSSLFACLHFFVYIC